MLDIYHDPQKFLEYAEDLAAKHIDGCASEESLHAHLLISAYERQVRMEQKARDLTQMMIMDLEILSEAEPQIV